MAVIKSRHTLAKIPHFLTFGQEVRKGMHYVVVSALLGSYTAPIGSYLSTFRDRHTVSQRRQLSLLPNFPEQGRSHLYGGGSEKSRTVLCSYTNLQAGSTQKWCELKLCSVCVLRLVSRAAHCRFCRCVTVCLRLTGNFHTAVFKIMESFEMWCWRRMKKISWTHHVRNEEVLLRINEQRNILHEIRKRKANWMGHILRRNCLLKQVIEGKIKGEMEVARRRGRRHKKLLDDLKDRRGYYHLKEEALDRTMWSHRFGGGFGPVVRQNTE